MPSVHVTERKDHNTIVVYVSGYPGSGKSIVVGLIKHALESAGVASVALKQREGPSTAQEHAMESGEVPDSMKDRHIVITELNVLDVQRREMLDIAAHALSTRDQRVKMNVTNTRPRS